MDILSPILVVAIIAVFFVLLGVIGWFIIKEIRHPSVKLPKRVGNADTLARYKRDVGDDDLREEMRQIAQDEAIGIALWDMPHKK